MKVFVLNNKGIPLMPCKPSKAKKLLKENKAIVIDRNPFTIKLITNSYGYKQPITLGVDSGFKHVGISAVSNNEELFAADIILRTDIPSLLLEKGMFRKSRRSRKTRYRKARFLNRKIDKGWFAPSINHKIDSHIKLINKVKNILPITDTIIEVASFDTQKMINPEISGIEYQQGELQGYEIRQYLLDKWNRKCAYCGKTNVPFEIEHIIPTSRGGSNKVSNLTIACHDCNQKKGNKTAKEFGFDNIQSKANKSLKDAAFMNIVRWKIINEANAKSTFGSITKFNRVRLNIPKSHINDAFVIAKGENQKRSDIQYEYKQIRKCNRKLRRGKNSEICALLPREVFGFRLFDEVYINGIIGYISSRRKTGSFIIKSNYNNILFDGITYKKLKFIRHQNNFLVYNKNE